MAIASEISVISDDYAIQLSLTKKENSIRTSCRKRQGENRTDAPTPIDRPFDIAEEFKTFLLKNSGEDDSERILIFGDTTIKNLFNFSKRWLIDGTFKLSPDICYQIYTIHIELKGFAPPCVYLRLPNKTEKTCSRMLELLCEETNAKPDGIHADFEKAALNAFSKKILDAKVSCCYFHLTQSFNRKKIGLRNLSLKFAFCSIQFLQWE